MARSQRTHRPQRPTIRVWGCTSLNDIHDRLYGPSLAFHDLLGLALDVVDNLPPMVQIPLDAFPWMEATVRAYVAGCEAYRHQPREHPWQSVRQRTAPSYGIA